MPAAEPTKDVNGEKVVDHRVRHRSRLKTPVEKNTLPFGTRFGGRPLFLKIYTSATAVAGWRMKRSISYRRATTRWTGDLLMKTADESRVDESSGVNVVDIHERAADKIAVVNKTSQSAGHVRLVI